jgi:hypothetical protein
MPKIIATIPKTGLEIVMPILRRLFSTTSVRNNFSYNELIKMAILTLSE